MANRWLKGLRLRSRAPPDNPLWMGARPPLSCRLLSCRSKLRCPCLSGRLTRDSGDLESRMRPWRESPLSLGSDGNRLDR